MTSQVRSAIGGAVAAGISMYLLDPDRGARRRALVRDKATRAARKTREAARATGHDLGNRLSGVQARARRRLRDEAADDATLRERVRATLGRATPHHRALSVAVTSGWVALTGDALESEVPSIVSAVERVRGVQGVDNLLRVHARPDGIPALQGETGHRRSWIPSPRNGWSPTTLAGAAAGITLVAAAVVARNTAATAARDADRLEAGRVEPPSAAEEGIEGFIVEVENLTVGARPTEASAFPDDPYA